VTYKLGPRPESPAEIEAVLDDLRKASTGTLGHLTDFGFASGLAPLCRPAKAVGLAFTVRIPDLDGTAVHYALSLARRGEVVVVDTSGQQARAAWGGVVNHAAIRAGIAGVVIDGPVTDWEEITASSLPVWCRGTTSVTARAITLEGAVEVPVQVGGAVVRPGDIVFADSDGVFFIPPDGAAELAKALLQREAREPQIKRRLDAGEQLIDINGARARFEENIA